MGGVWTLGGLKRDFEPGTCARVGTEDPPRRVYEGLAPSVVESAGAPETWTAKDGVLPQGSMGGTEPGTWTNRQGGADGSERAARGG